MWRRSGDVLYASIVLVVFTIEVIALGALPEALILELMGRIPYASMSAVLVGTIMATALGVLLVTAYIIGYHLFSAIRDEAYRSRLEGWREKWVQVLLEEIPLPEAPLPREGVETLLDLRDMVVGQEADRVSALVLRYDVEGNLVSEPVFEPGKPLEE